MRECNICKNKIENSGLICSDCGISWLQSINVRENSSLSDKEFNNNLINCWKNLSVNNGSVEDINSLLRTNNVLGFLSNDFENEEYRKIQSEIFEVVCSVLCETKFNSKLLDSLLQYKSFCHELYTICDNFTSYIDIYKVDLEEDLKRSLRRRHASLREYVRLKNRALEYKMYTAFVVLLSLFSIIMFLLTFENRLYIIVLNLLLIVGWFVLKKFRYNHLQLDSSVTLQYKHFIDSNNVPDSYLKILNRQLDEFKLIVRN